MNHQPFTVAIVAFAIISGIFSPVLVPNVTGAMLVLAPGLFVSSPQVLIFLVYLIGATLSIMVAGVPAALFERATGARQSTVVSMWIWLVCAAVVALPAVVTFVEIGF